MSQDNWKRTEPNIHRSARETRERNYDRLRGEGVPADAARTVADQAARESHDKLDKRG